MRAVRTFFAASAGIALIASSSAMAAPAKPVSAGSAISPNVVSGSMTSGSGVASKLSLAGAAGAGQSDCVSRSGVNGLWRVDAAGNWVRCARVGPGRIFGPGQIWIPIGLVVALGLALGFGLNGDGSPASP